MQSLGFFLLIGMLFFFYVSSFSIALTKVHIPVSRRELTTLKQTDILPVPDDDIKIEVDPSLKFENPRLKKAYFALQEWKKAIFSDPKNMTGNWLGPHVCSYHGVVCARALDDPNIVTLALIDLNFGDIAGHLVPHLGLLTDIAIFHIHSNRFCGLFPKTLSKLKLLFELDVSNNRFAGPFPKVVLDMPSLMFLDVRFNEFEGPLPPELFEKDLDAIVVNNNRFHSTIPDNIGNSQASILVLANNKFSGCIPKSFGRMPRLEQVSFSNNKLTGCLPEEIGMLKGLAVLDVSRNMFIGPLPKSLDRLKMIERFDFSSNRLTGKLQDSICDLPAVWNISITNNYFNEIGVACEKFVKEDKLVLADKDNCIPRKQNQKNEKNCSSVLNRPVDCKTVDCQPRNPSVVEPKNRKITPQSKATPTPPSFNDLKLQPNIGSRHSSPLPPVFQGS